MEDPSCHSRFWNENTSRVFKLPQLFSFVCLSLSISIFVVLQLGLDITNFLRGVEMRQYVNLLPIQHNASSLKSKNWHTGLGFVVNGVCKTSDTLAKRNYAAVSLSHKQHKLNEEMDNPLCSLQPTLLMEVHLLNCAVHIGRQNKQYRQDFANKIPPSRVAFLFLARRDIPHEPLWKRFFQGHEEFYSLYTHSTPKFQFPNTSFFYGHQVPSQSVARLSISLVDAMRRLLAYAMLDHKHGAMNSWFVFLCESTIPIRSFDFTYDYLTKSQHSFVESFLPMSPYLQWETEPQFVRQHLRKGETWMALNNHHAIMVLEDWEMYYKFKSDCVWMCGPDEQYIQTLLALKDPHGIANRTITYVNWWPGHTSSPFTYDVDSMTNEWFQDIQGRVVDSDGMYHDTSLVAKEDDLTSRICYYNGVPNSPCFLFARKVARGATEQIEKLPATLLGY